MANRKPTGIVYDALKAAIRVTEGASMPPLTDRGAASFEDDVQLCLDMLRLAVRWEVTQQLADEAEAEQ